MKVTYVWSSFSFVKLSNENSLVSYPLTPRIMFDILEKQKKLKVEYSNIPLLSVLVFSNINRSSKSKIDLKNRYKFCKEVIKTIKTEYVLLTLGSNYEILFLKVLLDSGKKVVVGGPLTKIYTIEELREILKDSECKNLENLIIVKPYINKNFDMYKVIMDWKDIYTTKYSDVSRLMICENIKDYYVDFKKHLINHNVKPHALPVMFQTNCRWGKCSFCRYRTSDKNHFLYENNVEELSEYLLKVSEEYEVKHITIHDPEFYFTKASIKFLDIMRKNGYIVSFFSSVRQLQNETYWNYIKEYSDVIQSILIGWESFDDYSLKVLNKGVTVEESWEVIFKMINHFKQIKQEDHKINLINMFMSNIISKSEESIIKNYKMIDMFNQLLKKNNIKGYISFTSYMIEPFTEYNKHPNIKISSDSLNIYNTFTRIDENGKFLESDEQILRKHNIELSFDL